MHLNDTSSKVQFSGIAAECASQSWISFFLFNEWMKWQNDVLLKFVPNVMLFNLSKLRFSLIFAWHIPTKKCWKWQRCWFSNDLIIYMAMCEEIQTTKRRFMFLGTFCCVEFLPWSCQQQQEEGARCYSSCCCLSNAIKRIKIS